MATVEEKVRSLEDARLDTEGRLRRIERALYAGFGIVTAVQFIIQLFGK